MRAQSAAGRDGLRARAGRAVPRIAIADPVPSRIRHGVATTDEGMNAAAKRPATRRAGRPIARVALVRERGTPSLAAITTRAANPAMPVGRYRAVCESTQDRARHDPGADRDAVRSDQAAPAQGQHHARGQPDGQGRDRQAHRMSSSTSRRASALSTATLTRAASTAIAKSQRPTRSTRPGQRERDPEDESCDPGFADTGTSDTSCEGTGGVVRGQATPQR